ncbi:uncharacterized protein PAC_02643 [Phialocephala subalpina]|uniref:Mei5 protein n=1 Tax=Phialocephala subalpina TaxID=576137 RepID=A0A1L7WJ34_9HELO|nr:uncharacterized protein PAC_02643 [Phialocephala subalpina]
MSGGSNKIDSSKSSAGPAYTEDMKNLHTILGRIFSKKEINNDFGEIRDKNRDLEGKLAAKETEIASLRSTKDSKIADLESTNNTLQTLNTALKSTNDTLLKEFGEKYKSWDAKTTKQKDLEDEVAALKLQLAQANQRASDSDATLTDIEQQLRERDGELQRLQEKLESVTDKLDKKEVELDGAWRKLRSCESTLQEERQELDLEDLDLDDLTARFNVFMETSHGLARKFFLTELIESEDLTWGNISAKLYHPDNELLDLIPRKFPLSNSIASQHLRMAMAEKIISKIYDSHIFRQYYLPESDEVGKILNQLYKENPRKEAIFRLILLGAIKPEAEESRVTSIVKSATDKVVDLLGPLFFAPNAEREFRSEFEELLQDAVDLWRHVQRSPKRGLVKNKQDSSWGCYEDHDTALQLLPDQEVHVPDEPSAIMSLFPRVVVDNSRVCLGYALWSNQNTVVAADLELKSRNSMNGMAGNSTGGIQRRRTRRFSGSGEDTPQSPRSPLGNLPALRHTQNRSISLPRRGEHNGTPGRE